MLLNEINARWGGGLVLHSVAAALLGDDYADRAAVSSLRDVPGTGLDAAVSRLRQSGLAFSHATGEGVVVLGAGPDAGPTTEMLVLAGTRARTRELEATTRSVFEAGVTPP
ncbi:peptide ligase PGM1-related protein [Frankia torreyi]|uniref:peptide ligase PGM1-related protein n=1 Tax=Frankia torreyi TaxID=1856 RepID=UPI003BB7C961